jgi:hypothetical protein
VLAGVALARYACFDRDRCKEWAAAVFPWLDAGARARSKTPLYMASPGVQQDDYRIAWPPDMAVVMNVVAYEKALLSARFCGHLKKASQFRLRHCPA